MFSFFLANEYSDNVYQKIILEAKKNQKGVKLYWDSEIADRSKQKNRFDEICRLKIYSLETFPQFSQTILLFISNVSKVKGIADILLRQKETRNINVALFIFDKVLTFARKKNHL